jgi:hypothetical protein
MKTTPKPYCNATPTHDVKHINHDDPKWETVKSRRRNDVNRNIQDTKNEKPTVAPQMVIRRTNQRSRSFRK